MFRIQPHCPDMAAVDTYSVGIDEAGDQKLPSLQIQSLELSAVANLFQEHVHVSSRYRFAGGLDLLNRLDNTVYTDIEE